MAEEKEKLQVRNVIQVDDELLENITNLVDEGTSESLITIFADLHSADIAEIINHLEFEHAKYVFNLLDTETASEVITEVDENLRERILREIDKQKITDIIDELDTDDATDIVSDLPDTVAQHVLENIDTEDSIDVKKLLAYPEDSAGGIMNSDYVFIFDTAKVKDAIEEVRKNAEEIDHIYYIYVLTRQNKLVGVVTLKSLLTNTLDTPVPEIMEEDLIYVTPEMDQEEVANVIEKYDIVSVPVVDKNMQILGRITVDDVVDVIHEEASEDLQMVAGLSEDEELSDSSFRISRNRLPWLFVSLVGEMVSAMVLTSFQASLEKVIFAASFIPIVMAMGGSSGTQAAIVMVRGLAMRDIWLSESLKRLGKEFRVALLNGLACSIVLLGVTHFFFHSEMSFSIILSSSLIIIMIFATMIGAAVPIVLQKLGVDPAIATGPFVATMNDIFGLLIYLSLITMFFIT
jgi:magnesium transporter